MPPHANISPVGVNPNLRPSLPTPTPTPTPTPESSSRPAPRIRELSNSFSRPPDMRLYTTVTDETIRQQHPACQDIIVQNHRDYTRSFNELKRILLTEIEELKQRNRQLMRQLGMDVPGDLIRLGSKKSKKKKKIKRNKSKNKKNSNKRTKRR